MTKIGTYLSSLVEAHVPPPAGGCSRYRPRRMAYERRKKETWTVATKNEISQIGSRGSGQGRKEGRKDLHQVTRNLIGNS